MAKKKAKRGPGRPPKKKTPEKVQHSVPNGFWRQVGAVFLIIFAIILALGLFNIGGVFPVGLAGATRWLIGWAAFVVPFLFLWQAVQIFRAEDNRLSNAVWVATVFFLSFFAGLFQLLEADPTVQSMIASPLGGDGGGAIGWLINVALLQWVSVGVAALILLVLILLLLLFVLSTSPKSVIDGVRAFFAREDDGAVKTNERVAKAVSAKDNVEVSGVEINNPTGAEHRVGRKEPKTASLADDNQTSKDKGLVMASDPDWKYPELNLLEKNAKPADPGDVNLNADIIRNTLRQFDIELDDNVKMGANVGPRITQYTMLPRSGTKLKRISALDDELRAALEAKKIRIEAPIPGRREVGIEVPNKEMADVRLYSMLESPEWKKADSELVFVVGRDTSNRPVVADLADMPHLLIAGQTKSGKSVMVNTILCSLLYRNSPSDLQLIMVDPKTVELGRYKDIPHLITPIITDSSTNPITTVKALTSTIKIMEERYQQLADEGVTNIQEYNEMMLSRLKKSDESADGDEKPKKMPYIVIVIDEMADLMMAAGKDVEALIIRLAQKGRAAGVHLILATQSPRKQVVTGLIKANVPATIAFAVKNYTESVIVLGSNGAEKLLGKGDMLFQTADNPAPRRMQGALVSNKEVNDVTSFIRLNNRPVEYDPDFLVQDVQLNGRGGVVFDNGGGEEYEDAKQIVIESGKASTSFLQRRMKIGYSKAAGFLDQMEEEGIVGPSNGSKGRDVYGAPGDTPIE